MFVFLLVAWMCQADFFLRMKSTAGTMLRECGGTSVYATDVEVNGQEGRLESFSFVAMSADEVFERVARKRGVQRTGQRGGGHLAYEQEGRAVDLLVLPAPGGMDQCLAFAIERTGSPQQPQWPADLPAFSAQAQFVAVCKKSATTFLFAESALSPEELLSDAGVALRQGGWQSAIAAPSSCQVFTLGRKQCILFTRKGKRSGRTELTLLKREGVVR